MKACIHFWEIEPAVPGHKQSHGICQKCAEERDFFNSLESQDIDWVSQGNEMACFGRRAPKVKAR